MDWLEETEIVSYICPRRHAKPPYETSAQIA